MTNLGSVATKKRLSCQMEKDGTTPEAKRQQVTNQVAAGSRGTRKDNKSYKSERFMFADVASTTADLYVLTKKREALTKNERLQLLRHINLACVPWMMAKKTLPTIVQWTNRRRGKAGPKHTVLRCETERDRELVNKIGRAARGEGRVWGDRGMGGGVEGERKRG